MTGFKHGQSGSNDPRRPASPTYISWQAMHCRCRDPHHPAFARYGGRGIKVCHHWRSFTAFLEDMGERPSKRHSIERIDNDGNYTPGNCRWATPTEQMLNRCNNRFLEFNSERLTISEWTRRIGGSENTIRERLRHGWSVADAVTRPPRGKS